MPFECDPQIFNTCVDVSQIHDDLKKQLKRHPEKTLRETAFLILENFLIFQNFYKNLNKRQEYIQ